MLATVSFNRLDLFRTERDQYGKRKYLHPKITEQDLGRVRAGGLPAFGYGRSDFDRRIGTFGAIARGASKPLNLFTRPRKGQPCQGHHKPRQGFSFSFSRNLRCQRGDQDRVTAIR